ncbi:collagen alpha-1(III) chain-like [Erinaceus europaeus]|uniref:Collagen alpha-1(III) chain-like n=1 Tax=Erinaceus europaeus TaxID=9365 RepID=A0ABM3YAQ2_ERIEU|nr:collagen alpha-1(III) chain-like [Erinaceus europaeus]
MAARQRRGRGGTTGAGPRASPPHSRRGPGGAAGRAGGARIGAWAGLGAAGDPVLSLQGRAGERESSGDDRTHLAAPPPPPAAAAEPAASGTIFRRRLVLGGGYQPPIRGRQPTQPPASQLPAAAPNSGLTDQREGSDEAGSRSGPSALGQRPGPGDRERSEPRGRAVRGTPRQRRGLRRAADTAATGFVFVDSVPSSAEHAGKRPGGRGAPGIPGCAERRRAAPEVGGLPGRGMVPPPALSTAGPQACPLMTQSDLAGTTCWGTGRGLLPRGA